MNFVKDSDKSAANSRYSIYYCCESKGSEVKYGADQVLDTLSVLYIMKKVSLSHWTVSSTL